MGRKDIYALYPLVLAADDLPLSAAKFSNSYIGERMQQCHDCDMWYTHHYWKVTTIRLYKLSLL